MKAKLILTAVAATLIAACNSKQDAVQSFIPGTYIHSAKSEYGQDEDTLIIKQSDGNTYQITRNTTYQAMRDGKLLPKHHKSVNLNGLYDPEKLILNETTTGLQFSFDPSKRLLLVNNTAKYKKL